MVRGIVGEVGNHPVEEAKWGVQVNGRVMGIPRDRKEIGVGIEVVVEPGTKEGELGIEGGRHCINLWWGYVLGMNVVHEVSEMGGIESVIIRIQEPGNVVSLVFI